MLTCLVLQDCQSEQPKAVTVFKTCTMRPLFKPPELNR
jgi:hypothetical protein